MRRKLPKILITGGCGFIGSNFIRHLIANYPGYRIINLDKLTYAGNPDNLKSISAHPNYSFVKGDICNARIVEKVIAGCDIAVNFAAETHVDRSIIGCDDFLKTNIDGVNQLLNAARKSGLKKFIQISTDEVYGSRLKGEFKETDKLNPRNPYSASKAAGDLLALSYYNTYGLEVIITRSSNNFGPYQYPEKVIPLFITNAREGKPLPLYGKGKNIRDWIFVEDNCRAIGLVMHKGLAGETYNIGAGGHKANIELARDILGLTGKPLSLIRKVEDRPGHDFRYALDCAKIRRLGWAPKYNFIRALEITVEWYSQNSSWWRKIKSRKEYRAYQSSWYRKRG